MELKEAIGNRRSFRFLRPYKPVEREKIQMMLEAARLSSFWGNVRALRAVVIERASAPDDVLNAIPPGTAIGGFQFRLAPVLIVWYLDWRAVADQGKRLHELVEAGAVGVDEAESHRYLDENLIPFFEAAGDTIRTSGVTELDCGQGIAQATLVATELGRWNLPARRAGTQEAQGGRSRCPRIPRCWSYRPWATRPKARRPAVRGRAYRLRNCISSTAAEKRSRVILPWSRRSSASVCCRLLHLCRGGGLSSPTLPRR